ncbi:MAG: helix-turn-helix transcriptional regulator [Candidatus Micrarchaeia archaeon]|jgi:DNA-binding transcriptional regulator YdaS (Cro superfamily)
MKTSPSKLAQVKVKYAVDHGHLIKPSACEKCGLEDIILHGHHSDYSKPLEVEWLCPACHGQVRAAAVLEKRIPPKIAKDIGVSEDYIRKINRGERPITPKLAKKIIEATGGGFSLRDFGPDLVDLITALSPAHPAPLANPEPAPETSP